MTSARLAARRARQELEFLEICEGYEQRLADAKQAVRDADDGPGRADAQAALVVAKNDIRAFRQWAREAGKPNAGRPGRDAVINVGGVDHGVGR